MSSSVGRRCRTDVGRDSALVLSSLTLIRFADDVRRGRGKKHLRRRRHVEMGICYGGGGGGSGDRRRLFSSILIFVCVVFVLVGGYPPASHPPSLHNPVTSRPRSGFLRSPRYFTRSTPLPPRHSPSYAVQYGESEIRYRGNN